MRSRQGRIDAARVVVEGRRLKARLSVLVEGAGLQTAYLPEREVAALLPRDSLAGGACEAPEELLATLDRVLARLVLGRSVRLWSYQERWYASFAPWRSVRFADQVGRETALEPLERS